MLQQPPLNESGVRDALLHRGLSGREIDEQLASARRSIRVMTSKPTSWEHITRVGYRNLDGQEIVHKTNVGGPEGQRIYVCAARSAVISTALRLRRRHPAMSRLPGWTDGAADPS